MSALGASASRSFMPCLKVTHPDMERTEYEFGNERVTLGREADNLIVIDDITCSRHHAVIEKSGRSWWLRDLGSTHGTVHKGSKIKELQLGDGAAFEIGARRFQFFLKLRDHGRAGKGAASPKHKAGDAEAVASPPVASPRPVIASASEPKPSRDASTRQVSDGVRYIRCHCLASFLLVMLVLGWGLNLSWEAANDDPSGDSVKPSASPKLGHQLPSEVADAQISVPSGWGISKASEKEVVNSRNLKLSPQPRVSDLKPGQVNSKAEAVVRKTLYSSLDQSAGFQPVLSPGLDSVLHIQASAEGPWVDVFLNERRILQHVKIVSESQLRFSEDGTAWAVQAEDKNGRPFVALRDRRIPAEGKIIYWTGNSDFSHMATVVRRNEEDHLYVDGEWRTTYHHISDVRLSKDGRKWACVVARQASGAGVTSAGERVITQDDSGVVCERVLSLQMDSAGDHVLWLAEHQGGRMVLMSGDECLYEVNVGKGEQIQSPVVSKEGGRIAWAVVGDKIEPRFHLEGHDPRTLPVLDTSGSKVSYTSILARSNPATRILFSRDGQHVVFAAMGHTAVMMHDGEVLVRSPVIQLDSLALSEDGLKAGCVVLEPIEEALQGKAQLHRAKLQATDMKLLVETNAWVWGKSAESSMIVGGISGLRFSPDHENLAWIRSTPATKGKCHIRQVWVGNEPVETSHENVTSFLWKSPQILVLADLSLNPEAISQVFYRISPVEKP